MKRMVFALAFFLVGTQPAHAGEVSSLTLVFAGDIMLDGLPGESVAQGSDPFERFAAELTGADMAFGNLECPVATLGAPVEKIFTFRASPRVLPLLARHFTGVSLANNHSGDYGKSALLETIHGLEAAHVAFFGAGANLAAAHQPLLIERAGLRIALLGYDEFQPRLFEAGFDTPGVAWSEDEQVIEDIRNARAHGADIVIPFMHWGWEHEGEPCERQRVLARAMLDAGADAVVGSHPHVTQGAELYRGKPIIYSLGNFVFDGFDTQAARTGWLVRLHARKSGIARFETLVARLDERGLPTPDWEAASPCGDENGMHTCRGGRSVTQAP